MARCRVTRRGRFEAAHRLPDHEGECRHVHGHSFQVWVTCEGELRSEGPEAGMVIDMGRVAESLRPLLLIADHADLNAVVPAAYLPPSTENLARWVYDVIARDGLPVAEVTVQETENQWATYRGE